MLYFFIYIYLYKYQESQYQESNTNLYMGCYIAYIRTFIILQK